MPARLVMESIQRLRDEADKKRISTYDTHEDFAIGGDRTKKYLRRHTHEEETDWRERRDDFAHWGYTGRVAHALSSALYGHDVVREIEGGTDAQNEKLRLIYTEARFESGQRLVANSLVTFGDAFVLPSWSSTLDQLMLHVVHPSNIYVETHPDDPYRELTVVEERSNPNKSEKPTFWVWSDDAFCVVDTDGAFAEARDASGVVIVEAGWNENPYGFIPHVHWRALPMTGEYWGISPIRDVVQLNKEINNRASVLGRTVKAQGFSIPVMRDSSERPGPDQLVFSEAKTINIGDPSGDFFFASPNAPIPAVQGTLTELIDRLFEVAGVPVSIVRGGSANSGYQLAVEYRTMQEIVADIASEAQLAEEDLAWKVCRIVNAHEGGMPDDPTIRVDMGVQIVPTDEGAERDRDLLDVRSGLMSKADYIHKWRPGVGDPAEYLAEIASERPAAGVATSIFGAGADESLL